MMSSSNNSGYITVDQANKMLLKQNTVNTSRDPRAYSKVAIPPISTNLDTSDRTSGISSNSTNNSGASAYSMASGIPRNQLTSGQNQLTSSQNQLTSGPNQLTSGQNQLTSGQNQLTSGYPTGSQLLDTSDRISSNSSNNSATASTASAASLVMSAKDLQVESRPPFMKVVTTLDNGSSATKSTMV